MSQKPTSPTPAARDPDRRDLTLGLLGLLGGGALVGACAPGADPQASAAQALTAADVEYAVTMVDLRAMTNAAARPFALLLGYAAAADGGGGLFAWAPGAASDDGGTVIVPTAGAGAWRRVYSGPVNARWFGARGDGTVDDTAAIEKAIAAADHPAYAATSGFDVTSPSQEPTGGRGGEVLLPRGVYVVSRTLVVPTSVHLGGEGAPSTQIKFTINDGVSDGISVRRILDAGSATLETRPVPGRLHDLELVASGSMGAAVLLRGVTSYQLFNVRIYCNYRVPAASTGAQYGVRMVAAPANSNGTICINVLLSNVHVLLPSDTGLYIENANSVSCRGCYFSFSRNHGVDASGEGHVYDQCVMESCGNSVAAADPLTMCGFVMRRGSVTLTGCYFENNSGYDLYLGSAARCHATVINPYIAVPATKARAGQLAAPDFSASAAGVVRVAAHAGGAFLGGAVVGYAKHVFKFDAPTGVGMAVLGFLSQDNYSSYGTTGSLTGYPGVVMQSPAALTDPPQTMVYGNTNLQGARIGSPSTSATADLIKREAFAEVPVAWSIAGSLPYNVVPGALVVGAATLAGAAVTDLVVATLTSNGVAGVLVSAFVSAPNTITVTVINHTTSAYTLTSGSVLANLWKR
ncbi:MAG: right-handed parallel beta-helix repeat-containing protein [Polyangiales bacterium]